MTEDRWTDRLSEYLDGELAPEELRQLEEHLGQCDGCRVTLDGLRAVVARAAALEDRPPTADLWPAVARGIGAGAGAGAGADEPGVLPLEPRRRARRLAFTLPQLAAAAVALMAVSAGTVWLAARHAPARASSAVASSAAGPGGIVAPAALTAGGYDAAVRDLEGVLARNRGRLDTATVHVLERNLRIIDAAIAESRRALAADPASPYLNTHLADTMQQKLDLLRQAARLATART
jgi:anti-sigma factor RsiW